MEKSGNAAVVKSFQGVAADRPGTLKLALNPIHPGDHKIAPEGIDVTAYTIDDLVRNTAASKVCLIKIDVQGAEERVLQGAHATIQRDHPAIFIELDDDSLKRMGSSAEKVVTRLLDAGYFPQRLGENPQMDDISRAEILGMCSDGRYVDLLFVDQAANQKFLQ